jgi:mutator protein MutT
MSSIIPCGVALIRRDREFLISQRKKNDSFGSMWEFPGGKKNPEESFEECVVREVKEEVGIDVCVHEKFMEISPRYYERIIWLNFFLCSHVSGDPSPVDCEKIEWVRVENLKNYAFPPANDIVIRKLNDLYAQH